MTDEKQIQLNTIFAVTKVKSFMPGAFGFGQDGDLIVRNSTDMKKFRDLTMGQPMIMGRKTFESLGSKSLDGRASIVVSKNLTSSVDEKHKEEAKAIKATEDCYLAKDLDDAVSIAKDLDAEHAWVIGGAQLIQEALPKSAFVYYTVYDYHAPTSDIDVYMNMNLILGTKWFAMDQKREYREECTIVKTGEKKNLRFTMMRLMPKKLFDQVLKEKSSVKKLAKEGMKLRKKQRKESKRAARELVEQAQELNMGY